MSSSEDGFSLVELLVAMVLVAVAVLAVVHEIETSERATARAARLQLAAATAGSTLDRLRALPYDRVAVGPAAGVPPPGGPQARRARTGDGAPGLRVPGGVEALVDEDAAAPLPAYERVVAATGGAQVVLHVHRFVTWRDEECELPGAPGLEAAIGGLRDRLRDLRAEAVALDAEARVAIGALGAEVVVGADGAVAVALRPLRALLDAALADAQATLAAAEALLDPLSGRLRETVDLCDLPVDALPAPRRVRAGDARPLADAVRAVRPAVTALARARDPAALAAGTTEVTGHVAAIAAAAEQTAAPVTEAGDALLRLARALDRPGTERNSKRIVVAVVVEGDLAPKRPAWASTVVTDPAEGLL